MARPPVVTVMISSRCNDPVSFEGRETKLTDVRRKLKETLEQERLFGSQFYDVWINEDAPPAEGSADSWETCLRQVRTADLILVLYNGNAGWAKEGGEIGICLGELQTALSVAPARVRLIELPLQPVGSGPARDRNQRFRDYVGSQSLFRGTAKTGEEVITRCKEALREATADMVKLGVREAAKGKYDRGAALDWSRLSFGARRNAMQAILRDALLERNGAEEHDGQVLIRIGGRPVVIIADAIPAAMTVAPARELVGQPFLRDYQLASILEEKRVGPVHFIACHRSVTESQAAKQLGFPDATIVAPPFGVYVADDIQKIQIVFVANCRDQTATRQGVQRVFDWLEQSGEGTLLSSRAASRARIVRAIAKESNN
jgi:hypothetical protein